MLIALETPTQRELSFFMRWLHDVSEGNEMFKAHIVKVINEVKQFLTKKSTVYTIDREYFHTIVFIQDVAKYDKELAQWIKAFNADTMTLHDYKSVYATLQAYKKLKDTL